MQNKKTLVAIIYDFDKTLCDKDMQEYSFIPNLGINSHEFWNTITDFSNKEKMDKILAYMYIMLKKSQEINKPLTKEYLNSLAKDINFFPGIFEWFDRINEYGKKMDLIIEHYIVSSGLKEIIEGTKISKFFKEIYACEFLYDEKGYAIWPKMTVNYTTKTQFLSRINKGVLDISDDITLNKKMLAEDRRISTKNIIYLGDGFTDIPCMKLVKEGGGVSVAVYTDKNIEAAKTLLCDGRINFMSEADYNDGSTLDSIIKKTIESMATNTELKNISYQQLNDCKE